MDTGINIRKATPHDARQAVILLNHAMASVGDHIFGDGNRERALGILGKLFVEKRNRFNYRYTFLAEKENHVAGLLLAYSSNLMRQLDLLTGQRLLRILQPLEMMRLVSRAMKQTPLKEADRDEYYISDLAVAPDSRDKKIGTLLLAFAEGQARKLGLCKCSLIVVHENEGAKRLYLRHGYQILDFIKSSPKRQKHGQVGYYRMVKEV
jgi:ribosomal protein S18 acetylase RimI-like enzyme